ncbi:MAG: hypothetical protein SFY95_07395 [Planctomycetota bacterium]|nr:hypothetical protein [Planctomycetota bacterium]
MLIDADRFLVLDRLRQLNEVLSAKGEAPLDGRDNVIVLVPKWCIETWALVAKGESIAESTRIDRKSKSIDPKEWLTAADTVFDWCRDESKVPAHCVPSLRSSLPKLGTLRPC